MRFERLRSKINELQKITSTWQEASPVSQLEMDMALDRVKQIYELLRFEDIIVEEETEEKVEESTEEMIDPIEEVEATIEEELEEVIEEMSEEAIEVLSEAECVEEEIEESAEEMIEEVVESLTEEESIPAAVEEKAKLSKRERYNRILSLYGDSEVIAGDEYVEEEEEEVYEDVEEDVEDEVEEVYEEPIKEEPQNVPTTPTTNRPSMSQQLTLNDRFLLSHDLFDDDMEALNRALEQLDEQPSYDDAIIFIAEEYSWSGSSAGAQIMITLLKNRFSLN